MGERVLLDRKGLQEALGLRGFIGRCAAGLLYRLLGLEYLNGKYQEVAGLSGSDFSSAVLDNLGISYELPPGQEDLIPAEGGFLTVSNHHFGGADGLILNAVAGARRKDFKIMTTFLLASIRNLKDSFIPVDNFSSGGSRSLTGIRSAMEHLAGGGSLGIFPAGEVATWQRKGKRTALGGKRVVEDKPWSDTIVKFIRNTGLPVIPVYFDGGNSTLFHILGKIHPMLRTVRLVREMTGKKGSTIKVRIGRPIPADEIAGMDIPSLGRYLRSRCYALEAQCVSPVKDNTGFPLAGLAEPEDSETIRSQMESLDGKMLFQAGDYRVYLIETTDAPAVMRELYRLREETFRAVGEGTGNPSDTDRYDPYYKHLILWSVSNGEIVGAYRVGYGSEIYPRDGIDGFYTSSMLRYGPPAPSVLPHSLELGRSFVSVRYQKEVLPLKLMLTGLTVAVTKDPEVTCCLGTVSISNSMPDFYKSLTVRFLEDYYHLPEGELLASPTHPFTPGFLRVNPNDLLKVTGGDIDAFDRLLWAVSGGLTRLPVLLRKYFSCGARVSCFNVDPLFSNCLDSMIVLKLSDFPPKMLRSIVRPLSQEMQETVFTRFYGSKDFSYATSLLMIRPSCFGYNEETAANNKFQHNTSEKDLQGSAVEEFDGMVSLLREHGIPVTVIDDSPERRTPDSVFPNNWFSTHADGTLVLYPMFAPNRRKEHSPDIIQAIKDLGNIKRVVDLTGWEAKGKFLEGTGSLVLDRKMKTAYACRSPRTSEVVLDDFCMRMGYSHVLFDAIDRNGDPIYHTNVIMSIGEDFALICREVITSPSEYSGIVSKMEAAGRKVVEISYGQMLHFAANILQLRNPDGELFTIMSDTAYASLDATQLETIKGKGSILAAHIPHIEEVGGGSARCMMAEIILPFT